MSLISKFENTLLTDCKANRKHRFLVAVSGGIDSVVLCYLFKNSGLSFAIAHCNFQLRADAADADAVFVEQLANQLTVPFFSADFDTNAYVKKHKISIQEAARSLRYTWFETIRKKENFDFIVTAHHANDQAETIFYNLIKGTGLNGLKGMLFKNNYLLRPLLKFSKEEIFILSKNFKAQHREDASNKSTKYARNSIRLEMLPVAETINSNFTQEMFNFSKRITEIQHIYKIGLEVEKRKLLEQKEDDFYISILKIQKHPSIDTLLFEILQDFNFSTKQLTEVKKLLQSETGKLIQSSTHRLLKDRKHLIITPLDKIDLSTIHVLPSVKEKLVLRDFTFEICPKNAQQYSPEYRPKVAVFDAEKIVFPLTLRKWQAGDYFYPFGMTKVKSDKIGKKKLKRFFTDLKLSGRDKEKIWIVQDAKKRILWVVGLRIDARFSIDENTTKILRCKLTNVATTYAFF